MDDDATQTRINHYWDHRAPIYDQYQQSADRLTTDRELWAAVFAAVLPESPREILDLGTGSGFLAFVLASLGHRVTGTDLSETMLEIARGHAEHGSEAPEFRRGDAVHPDKAAQSVDVITSRYLMWTLRAPTTAVTNWRRILRPGGTLAIVDAAWFPQGLDANATAGFAEHYTAQVRSRLPLAEAQSMQPLVEVICAAGFEDITCTALHQVYEVDRIRGAVPGHQPQLQYLITAKAPAGSGD